MSTTTADTDLLAQARTVGDTVRRDYHHQITVAAALDAAGTASDVGYRSTGRLLEDLWRLDPTAAKRLLRHALALTPRLSSTGELLPPRLPATAAAVADGQVSADHVEIIDQAIGKIRDIPDLPLDDEAAAEALLAESAAVVAPAGLRRVADRLVDTLDPDGAAPPDPDEPLDEMTMSRRRTDTAVRFAGMLHGVEGEAFWEAVDALSAPAGPDDERSLSQRRAAAICELAAQALCPNGISPRRRDTDGQAEDHLGDHEDGDEDGHGDKGERTDTDGGVAEALGGKNIRDPQPEPAPDRCATVPVRGRALLNVTIGYRDLLDQVGHGLLDSGLAITPHTVRRLACDAGIVPTLLGTRSEPLDIGRLSYTTPEGMRRALHHRDRGCAFPGCTRRPRRCHAHHIDHWLDGGDTALDNMCLLCRYHHHVIHHSDWTITMRDGRPWFTPPRWLDPTRTPRPGGVDTTLAG